MIVDHDNHDQVAELASAYALGSLEPDDVREFEAHMRSCRQCTKAVADMEAVAGVLAHSVPQLDPPPRIRQELIRRIAAERAPRPAIAPSRARPRWLSFVAPAAVAAAIVLLIIASVIAVRQHDELERLRTVQALIAAPSSRVVPLNQDGIHAKLIVKPGSNEAYMAVSGLPPLPASRDYQVWLLSGSRPESVGVFHSEGTGRWILKASRPMKDYKWVGVTREPRGGSPQPTTQPIIASNLR